MFSDLFLMLLECFEEFSNVSEGWRDITGKGWSHWQIDKVNFPGSQNVDEDLEKH